MHEDDVPTAVGQVAALIRDQFPRWSGLPITAVADAGTDHCLFRLGDELVVRMPRASWAADQARSDVRWLPLLAPQLPLAVPTTVAVGRPDGDYPYPWSVVRWAPGANPSEENCDQARLATDLAEFVAALHRVDTEGGPVKPPGTRGAPVRAWDESVRSAIAAAGDRIDAAAATRAWEQVVDVSDHDGAPVWIHGDLHEGNLLVDDRRLVAVIDWGAVGVGDPASDLSPYWLTLEPAARASFRERLGYDDETWMRGLGWALAPSLTAIPYYWDTAPALARRGLRTLDRVLADLR